MKTMVIGIAGPSAGGKTSVARAIQQGVKADQVLILKYDDYYKDQSDIPLEERILTNYDHPNAFDTELLIEDICKLKEGKQIEKPIYDYQYHTRKKETEIIKPHPVIVIEGLFTLLESELRDKLDLKIYVNEDSDICFIRRLKRDTIERGRTAESVIKQYIETVKPMQEKFIENTKKYADVIILRGKENQVGIKIIVNDIDKFLNTKKGEL